MRKQDSISLFNIVIYLLIRVGINEKIYFNGHIIYIVCDDAAFGHETPSSFSILWFYDILYTFVYTLTHRSIELNHHSLEHKIYNNNDTHTHTQSKHKINFPVENFRTKMFVERSFLCVSFIHVGIANRKKISFALFVCSIFFCFACSAIIWMAYSSLSFHFTKSPRTAATITFLLKGEKNPTHTHKPHISFLQQTTAEPK